MAKHYSTTGLPPAPTVSMETRFMAGLLVDVFGLDELAAGASVTCLWLLHPRTRTRARMHDVARRTVDAWHQQRQQGRQRGLVALAFDMPNHGSRLISELANKSWQQGNEQHALDMAGIIRAGRADLSTLMDLVGGYLGRDINGHVVLGWSLGGHTAWQAVFCEERVEAAVVVVGCPDYMGLMADRAVLASLDTGVAPLLGSRFLPAALMTSCEAHDPCGLLFGAGATSSPWSIPTLPLARSEQARLRRMLDARLRGKRVLTCSGGDDALVPYARSAPLLGLLKDAAAGWYQDGGFVLDDRVYEGVGHAFSADMVQDAVAFLVGAVAEESERGREGGGKSLRNRLH